MEALGKSIVTIALFCFATLAFGWMFAFLINGVMDWPIGRGGVAAGTVLSLVFGAIITVKYLRDDY